ncbi:MAG: HlyD family efflux transporter periplasmic adaptor subunit [Myxococcales bacterium FL481]|nr:MAG: HlyD family efflux transporter periplasmic adaptor subunit [Myxococcales bacterium FL481]
MSNKNHRTLVRWVKRALGAAFLLAVVGMVVVAWIPKPLPIETAEVTRGDLLVTVSEDGRTRVKDRYVVSAPLAGNLARIELRPGDDVSRDRVLARIVPVTTPLLDARSREQARARVAAATAGTKRARAQIERAKAALAFADQEAQRIAPLVEQGIESASTQTRAELDQRTRRAELTSARFAARVAEYELEMANSALRRAGKPSATEDDGEEQLVSSPIGGRVLKVLQASEGVVAAGSPLIEIGDPAALEIVVDVLTRDAVQIEPGADVTVDGWGGEGLHGNVRTIEPSAFTRLSALGVEEQRVNVVIDIEPPYEQWARLGDGYRVDAHITVWREADITKVPASALFRQDDGWAVFVVRDEMASLVPVEIGRRNAMEAQVVAGIESGETVVLHPSDRVADGIAVTSR